jgi:hypothetical protein
VISFTVISSCNHDEIEPIGKRELSLFVPDKYINADEEYWIFLSSDDGSILDVQQLYNNTTYQFTAPDSYSENDVTLSYIKLSINPTINLFNVQTYVDVLFLPYNFLAEQRPTIIQIEQSATLLFSDFLEPSFFDNVRFIMPDVYPLNPIQYNPPFTIPTFPNLASPVLLVNKEGSNPPSYIYLTLNSNDVVTKSLMDFRPGVENKVVLPYDGIFHVVLSGINDTGKFSNLFSYDELAVDKLAVKIHVPWNIFTSYETSLYLNAGDKTYVDDRRSGLIPSTFELVNADIVAYTTNQNNIQASVTGTFDVLTIDRTGTTSNAILNWSVHDSGLSSSIVVPQLPATLMSRFSDLKQWRDMGASFVMVKNFDSLSGYEEFIGAQLNATSVFEYDRLQYVFKEF